MSDVPLTPAEESILSALRKLVRSATPHPTGGFSPDDVSMHCTLSADDVQTHFYELADRGLVQQLDADGNPWDSHFTLPL